MAQLGCSHTQLDEEGCLALRAFVYDGDGVLRRVDESGAPKTRHVTSDYQIDIPTGQARVYYRFGGRAVAWRDSTSLRSHSRPSIVLCR